MANPFQGMQPHPQFIEGQRKGTVSGKFAAARDLAMKLEGKPSYATEQAVFDWLNESGFEMEIVDERWVYKVTT